MPRESPAQLFTAAPTNQVGIETDSGPAQPKGHGLTAVTWGQGGLWIPFLPV